MQNLQAAGANVVVLMEIASFRIDFARKNAGVTRVIDLNSEDIGEVLSQTNGAPEADVVIDTVGTLLTHRVDLDALPEGIEMLRRGEAMKVVVYPHSSL